MDPLVCRSKNACTPLAALRASSRARAIFSASTKSSAMGRASRGRRRRLGECFRECTCFEVFYSGMLSVPFEKVIWSAAAGVAGVSGTFCDFETTGFVDDRGVVRTTWLRGMGRAPRPGGGFQGGVNEVQARGGGPGQGGERGWD